MTDETETGTAIIDAQALPTSTVETAEVARVMSLMQEAIRSGHAEVMPDLHRIYEAERNDARQRAYIQAKLELTRNLPIIGKDGAILNKAGQVQSRYSSWEALNRVISPILDQHGFILDHRVGDAGGVMTVEAVLSHVSGHVEHGGPMRLPADTSGAKNAVQGSGSSLSYGMRYTTLAILRIRIEGIDDDGGPRVEDASLGDLMLPHVQQSRAAAARGSDAYTAWFREQSNAVRGHLVDTGEHENNKQAAAAHDEAGG